MIIVRLGHSNVNFHEISLRLCHNWCDADTADSCDRSVQSQHLTLRDSCVEWVSERASSCECDPDMPCEIFPSLLPPQRLPSLQSRCPQTDRLLLFRWLDTKRVPGMSGECFHLSRHEMTIDLSNLISNLILYQQNHVGEFIYCSIWLSTGPEINICNRFGDIC